jgi:hypothetical protein
MKTAISIPDKIYVLAQRMAHRMGLSRSKLYVIAIKAYLEKCSRENVTQKLNEIYGEIKPGLHPSFQSMQVRSLPKHKW